MKRAPDEIADKLPTWFAQESKHRLIGVDIPLSDVITKDPLIFGSAATIRAHVFSYAGEQYYIEPDRYTKAKFKGILMTQAAITLGEMGVSFP